MLQWLFPSNRLTVRGPIFWLLLVAVSVGVGFLEASSIRMRSTAESVLLFGGLGVGTATCVTAGLYIVANVQGNRLRKGAAVLHLVTWSFVSVLSTPLAIVLARPLFPRSWCVLSGEAAMGIGNVSVEMGMIAIVSFVLLTVVILLLRRPAKEQRIL